MDQDNRIQTLADEVAEELKRERYNFETSCYAVFNAHGIQEDAERRTLMHQIGSLLARRPRKKISDVIAVMLGPKQAEYRVGSRRFVLRFTNNQVAWEVRPSRLSKRIEEHLLKRADEDMRAVREFFRQACARQTTVCTQPKRKQKSPQQLELKV